MPRRRLRLRLVNFAKGIGAVRSDGEPDWYRVTEVLAEIVEPKLLEEDGAMTQGPGAPKKNDDELLAVEVHRVMLALGLNVEGACAHIAAGGDVPLQSAPWMLSPKSGVPEQVASLPGKRWGTRSSQWKGIKAATLTRRYYSWREAYTES